MRSTNVLQWIHAVIYVMLVFSFLIYPMVCNKTSDHYIQTEKRQLSVLDKAEDGMTHQSL